MDELVDKLLFAAIVIFGGAALGLTSLAIFGVIQSRMKSREVEKLLKKHPGSKHVSVFLPLHSTLPGSKRREIDAKVEEMEASEWTNLGFCAANPFCAMRFWGGAVTLHFMKFDASEE